MRVKQVHRRDGRSYSEYWRKSSRINRFSHHLKATIQNETSISWNAETNGCPSVYNSRATYEVEKPFQTL